MKTYKNLYGQIYSKKNLILAYKKARKGKSKKNYVKDFEMELRANIKKLQNELENQTYKPNPLEIFILRDPKTRRISKADFRDRIVHHAIINILEPIFDKTFIYDSCANRKGKGNLFAVKRFDKFKRKVSKNGLILTNYFKDNNYISGFCLKCDIKHYFQEINHKILLNIIKRKIKDEKVIWLIKQVLDNYSFGGINKGMPLGNLTSQFFANIYLNELDYFVKHKLKAKYYIRYVDDFIILHSSKERLVVWKQEIDWFLGDKLELELHSDKSKIIPLSQGIDFVGFRNFYYFKLLRKRNIKNIQTKILEFKAGIISYDRLAESFWGWWAYAIWADSFKLRKKISKEILNYKNLSSS